MRRYGSRYIIFGSKLPKKRSGMRGSAPEIKRASRSCWDRFIIDALRNSFLIVRRQSKWNHGAEQIATLFQFWLVFTMLPYDSKCFITCIKILQYASQRFNVLRYAWICLNMLPYVFICLDMLQYASICFVTGQSKWTIFFRDFRRNESHKLVSKWEKLVKKHWKISEKLLKN